MDSFTNIIRLWPSAEAFGADIGIPGGTARQWRRRNSIPAEHWVSVVNAASRREIEGVTFDLLASIAARGAETEARNEEADTASGKASGAGVGTGAADRTKVA